MDDFQFGQSVRFIRPMQTEVNTPDSFSMDAWAKFSWNLLVVLDMKYAGRRTLSL
jgi:hypothetical protein